MLFRSDQSAPIYQCLLRLYPGTRLTEWQIRFPAALFGWLSIPAAWLFARSLFGPLAASTSVLWIACSPWLVYHSREARPYTLFVFFATTSMFLFHRLLNRGGLWVLMGFVTSTVLSIYSHYFGFAILGAQLLLWIAESR